MAATPKIPRLVPITRNQGIQIPNLWPLSLWVDSVALTANTAYSYVLKSDGDTDFNLNTHNGIILRLCATVGPIFIDPKETAVIPTATTTNGLSAICIHPELELVTLVMPLSTETLSIICSSTSILTIEAWW
jgi:hypothetical protein